MLDKIEKLVGSNIYNAFIKDIETKEETVAKLLDCISKEIHKAIDDNFVMEEPNELVIRLYINTLRKIE